VGGTGSVSRAIVRFHNNGVEPSDYITEVK
jgi:hypothetical protein